MVVWVLGMAPPERPVLFMKASSALAGPEEDILMPNLPHGDELDWEVELAGECCISWLDNKI